MFPDPQNKKVKKFTKILSIRICQRSNVLSPDVFPAFCGKAAMKVSKASMVRLRHLAGFSRGRWAVLKAASGRPLDHPGGVHLL
jgi:hypothetical protein